MNKIKLCCIFNIAPKYRKNIYTLMDREYDCEWYFGENKTDIKGLDLTLLQNATEVDYVNYGNWYWQKNIVRLICRKDLDNFLVLGEPFCLSTWVLLLVKNIFYRNKKVYMWTHGWYGRETFAKKIIKKAFFKLTDGLFIYGNYAKKLMIEEGFDANRLHVIHNSLDYDKQLCLRQNVQKSTIYSEHFGNNHPTIILIGRLNLRKKISQLIDAIEILRIQEKLFNVVLVGNGEDKDTLMRIVQDKGLENQFWFYGACYDEETNANLIYNSDLCIVPGDIGLTAIHAMMFGVPVITHDYFPNQGPEFECIKSGVTGEFFKQNNSASLAETIDNWFINHKDKREQIRQKCYDEIDSQWTPYFQLNVLRNVF